MFKREAAENMLHDEIQRAINELGWHVAFMALRLAILRVGTGSGMTYVRSLVFNINIELLKIGLGITRDK